MVKSKRERDGGRGESERERERSLIVSLKHRDLAGYRFKDSLALTRKRGSLAHQYHDSFTRKTDHSLDNITVSFMWVYNKRQIMGILEVETRMSM